MAMLHQNGAIPQRTLESFGDRSPLPGILPILPYPRSRVPRPAGCGPRADDEHLRHQYDISTYLAYIINEATFIIATITTISFWPNILCLLDKN